MPEETIINPETPPQEGQIESPADIIAEMKANTVPKAKHEALQSDYNKLLKALANGEDVTVTQEAPVDINALRKELYVDENPNMTDLEMITKTLKLRQALIDNGEPDPFVPTGTRVPVEDSDYAAAQRVADVLQQCVDYADGDNSIFVNELQRRTMDIAPIKKAVKNRK